MSRLYCLLLIPLLGVHADFDASVEATGGWGADFATPRSHHPANALDGLIVTDRSLGPLLGLGLEVGWNFSNDVQLGVAGNYLVRTTSWNRDGSQVLSNSPTDSVTVALQEDGSETFQFVGAGPCIALIARKWAGFRILAEFGGVYASFRDHWESRDSSHSTASQSSNRSAASWVPGYMIGADFDIPLKRGAGLRIGMRYSTILEALSDGSDAWSAQTRSWQRIDATFGGYIGF